MRDILFPFVISLVTVFLGAKDITVLFGVISLSLIFIIMGNYIMKGHTKDTTNFNPQEIKINLFTLLSLTLIFSLMILVLISFNVSKYFSNLFDSYPFLVFLVAVPPLYVSNYILDTSRLTFFRDQDIAKIFISNILHYSVISVIIVIILSDIPVALFILKRQDVMGMIYWINGFVFFIAQTLTIILKKTLLFGLESKILKLYELKRAAHE